MRRLLTAGSVLLFSFHSTGEAAAGSHPAGTSPEGLGQQPALCEGGQEIRGAALSPNGSVLRTPSIVGPISYHRSFVLRAPFGDVRIGADLDGSWGGLRIIANEPNGVDHIAEGNWVAATRFPESVRGTIYIQGLPTWLDPEEYTDVAVGGSYKRTEGDLCYDGQTWYWRERNKEGE